MVATPAAPRPSDERVDVLEPLAEQLGGVQQRGEDDDGGPVLVVVEDGDVELLP